MFSKHVTGLVFFGLMVHLTSVAQLSVQLNVAPTISPNLYEWELAQQNDILVSVTNFSTDNLPAVFGAQLMHGSVEVGHSLPGETPFMNIPPGTSVFPLAELIPVGAIEYTSDFDQTLVQTGQLPDGNYTLCVTAYEPELFQPISEPSCAPFLVLAYQDPVNVYPPDGELIDAAEMPNLIFQWSPVAPTPEFGDSYVLSVYEVFLGQSPLEAVEVNPTVLDEFVVGTTQFVWPIEYLPLDATALNFVWTVTPVSPEGTPYTSPDGHSQPTVFGATSSTTETDCECVSCEFEGLFMSINGSEVATFQIPANTPVSFAPHYNIVCSSADCVTSIEGTIHAEYSSQLHPNQTWDALNPDEEITLPGNGLLYLTWNATAYCNESPCECSGAATANIQWQVVADDDNTHVADSSHTTTADGSDPHTVETTCECNACTLSSLSFLSNGAPITAGNIPTGTPLTLLAEWDISCSPEECLPLVDGYFQVGYTPEGEGWTSVKVEGPDITFTIPEGVGMVIVDFVGTVSCDGVPCPCDFANGLEFFTGPGGGSIPPFPEDEDEPDTIRVPTEPPPETQPKECDPLVKQLDPAQRIDLGMVLDDPATFPYPRAVPLRAEGIDWDYAIFQCSGCDGGPSETKYPVKDKMNLKAYQWKIIKGPGSLDDPFRADSLLNIERELDSLVARLQELEAQKNDLETRLNSGIAADSSSYANRIAELEGSKADLEERIQTQADSIAVIKGLLDAANSRFDLAKDSLDLLNDSIADTRLALEEIQQLLANPPSQPELDALAVVDQKSNNLDNANTALSDYEVQMESDAQAIADNLEALNQAQQDANQTYLDQRDQILQLTEDIRDLEDEIYGPAPLRQYRKMRTIWNQRANTFRANFVSQGSLANNFDSQKQDINSQARALATTLPANRGDMYAGLHADLLQFMGLPPQACVAVPTEDAGACGEMQAQLIEATFNLDTALANLNSSAAFINTELLAQLGQMQTALNNIKDGLETARNAARSAAVEYQDALAESVNQLKDLEEQKNEFIEAVEVAKTELAEAQLVYAAAKAERQRIFEENEPLFQDSLSGIRFRLTTETGRANVFFDRLSLMQDSVNTLKGMHDELSFEKAEMDVQLETMEATLAKLEQQLADLAQEPEKIKEEIKKAEAEIDAIKKALEKIKKRKNTLSNPRRSAVGPQVYYIPPPLEEVLEINGKKPQFDELVAKVDSAKANLKSKRAAKAILQAKIATAIDDVGWELLSFKRNTDETERLKEELDELGAQLASDQQEVVKKQPKDTANLDELENKYRQELQEAEEALEENGNENQERQQNFEEKQQAKSALEAELEALKEEVRAARSGVVYQENLFRNSKETLNERRRKVQEEQKTITEINSKIGRQQNKESIDKAAQDDDNITSNETESAAIQALRDELEAAETALESSMTDLQSIESSHTANNQALLTAKETYNAKDSLRRVINKKYLTATDSLIAAKEAVEKGNSASSSWEKRRAEAERNLKRVLEAKKRMLATRNEAIDSDTAVSATQAQIDRIEEQLADLDNELKNGETNVKTKLSDTEAQIKKTNQELQDAINEKDKAEEDLRTWLVAEFEKVFMEVKIQLVGDDEVCDQWRSNDGQAKLVRTLKYQNTRIPSLDNKFAKGGLPRIDVDDVCDVVLGFDPGINPEEGLPPTPRGPEPRTIALIYENGKPLWPEWPVIDQDETRYLQHDVVFLRTAFSPDFDNIKYQCESRGECPSGPPILQSILDPGKYNWVVKGRLLNPNQNWRYATWETSVVPIPKKWELQELKSIFNGNLIVGDPEVESLRKYKVHPGVLIEVPDSLFGKPDTTIAFHGRTVAGNHKGLAGERMVFSATLTDGMSEGWGFAGDTIKEVATDGSGIGEVEFDFGDGYARFLITVTWYRGDEVMDQKELPAIAPIRVKIHRMNPGPPEPAWQLAYSIIGSGEAGDLKSLTGGLPNCSYDGDSQPTEECAREMRCVAGLTNHYYEFVEGEVIEFAIDDADIQLQGPQDTTAAFGLGTTLLKEMGEDVKAEITASVIEEYLPLGRPGTDKAGASTALIEEFYIGEEDELFLVILDTPVPEGSTVNGSGMFGAGEDGILGLMIQLSNVKLTISDVSLEKSDGKWIATAGFVGWEGDVSTSIQGFEITVTKVGVEAGTACAIEGAVAHGATFPEPIEFYGMLIPAGDFLAGVRNLPEIEVMKFVLRQGAEVELDMMSNAGQHAPPNFKGIFIRTAELQLPDEFKRASTNEPTVLAAENFSIGTDGVSGSLTLTGSFFEIGFRGYALEGTSLSATFAQNELTAFSAGAALTLGSPFSGKVETELGFSGDEYFANISTAHPVEIPRLTAVFNLLPNTGIIKKGDDFTLRINALVSSEDIGDLTVNDFTIDQNGVIAAENIALDGTIKFGEGFEIQQPKLSFRLVQSEYFIELNGSLVFPLFNSSYLSGTVALYPGPELQVALDSSQITVEFQNAVTLSGGFRFNGNEFRGDFAVSLKNMSGDIEGLFLIGSHDTNAGNDTYTYWYAELSVPVVIPLGQTGLSILSLGGGIGYQYFPPTGETEGYPVENGGFAFKAMVGFGNTPAGKVFAGDVEMVLASTAFSLYGRMWVLTLRETFYGEGQVTLHFASSPKLDGHLRMFVALPDNEGKLLNFDGRIAFLFSEPEWYIRSDRIEGLFLSLVEAEGHVDVDATKVHLDAALGLEVNTSIDFTDQEKILISLDAGVSGTFDYIYAIPQLSAQASFSGNWSVILKNRIHDLTITSGQVNVNAGLLANSTMVSVNASAEISWNFFISSGAYTADLGYTKTL